MKLDASLLVIMGIFWITYVILRTCFFTPLMRLLDARENRLETARDTYETAFAETNERLDGQRAKLARARAEATARREQLRREAHDRRQAQLAEARAVAQGQLAEAQAELGAQVARERETLKDRAQALAGRIVARLLGRAA